MRLGVQHGGHDGRVALDFAGGFLGGGLALGGFAGGLEDGLGGQVAARDFGPRAAGGLFALEIFVEDGVGGGIVGEVVGFPFTLAEEAAEYGSAEDRGLEEALVGGCGGAGAGERPEGDGCGAVSIGVLGFLGRMGSDLGVPAAGKVFGRSCLMWQQSGRRCCARRRLWGRRWIGRCGVLSRVTCSPPSLSRGSGDRSVCSSGD